MDVKKYIVEDENKGIRLDKGISDKDNSLSRVAVQRLIENGKILVNGKLSKASYKLQAGDEISIEKEEPVEIKLEAEEIILKNKLNIKEENDNDQRCYKVIRKTTPVVEVKEEEIETKKEKIDFTSEQSWIKELDTWGESKVMAKVHRMGLDHYNFTFSEAKRYIAKNESRNGRDSRFGDCY